ncbi:MAG: 3-phenylpropionate/trans-cinnamate dioxygenase ferredoxin reductase subunit [Gammaproteobacteria bacterium]|jgi:3-phenylpropionate/trans-cinnamate dioxygenase ferredoxin reductase subunit
MEMNQTCVVIGASHAAASFVTGLRQDGWEGKIQVIGDEPYIPYHRPPLSKDLLAGKKNLEDIFIRPQEVYIKADVEFLLGVRAEEIDANNHQITLANGNRIHYDKLALTVGSRVRKISMPRDDLPGICYLRDYNDVLQIKSFVKPGGKAVIIGGGYIGLEAAAVLNKLGMHVTVLEMMSRVLERVTAPEISEFYTRIHTEEGVDIRCEIGATGFEGNENITRVLCNNNTSFDADLVIVGIGIIPNIELAQNAGLNVENGIVVDEYAKTSDPDIVSAGDCTSHYNAIYDRWIRLESVQNASDQARVAASTIAGKEKTYNALPWFWSDQYDVKLQIAGLSQGYDEIIIRGDRTANRTFAAFYLKDGKIIAVDALNKAPEFMMGKRLILDKVVVDKNKLADDKINIRELASK